MNIKREYRYFFTLSILSLLFISLFSGFASAADSSGFVEGVKNIFGPISNALFGANDITNGSNGPEMIFEALLFALIIISIVYASLNRVPLFQSNTFALWVVSIACSVLGTRFMLQNNWLSIVMIPQGVLGISLIVLIPFLVFFWFVEFSLTGERYKTIRKICWSVYAVVWTFLWFDQQAKIAGQLEWLYPLSVIVAVAMLFLDGTFQKLLNKMSADRINEGRKTKSIDSYKLEMINLKQIYDSDPTNYVGHYHGGGKGRPHGIQAYNADLTFLQRQMASVL